MATKMLKRRPGYRNRSTYTMKSNLHDLYVPGQPDGESAINEAAGGVSPLIIAGWTGVRLPHTKYPVTCGILGDNQWVRQCNSVFAANTAGALADHRLLYVAFIGLAGSRRCSISKPVETSQPREGQKPDKDHAKGHETPSTGRRHRPEKGGHTSGTNITHFI